MSGHYDPSEGFNLEDLDKLIVKMLDAPRPKPEMIITEKMVSAMSDKDIVILASHRDLQVYGNTSAIKALQTRIDNLDPNQFDIWK